MARNWKTRVYQVGADYIPKSMHGWYVVKYAGANPISRKRFSTKSAALKYAKAYMKKH